MPGPIRVLEDVFEDTPAGLRRLVLILLALTGPMFVLVLGALSDVRAHPAYLGAVLGLLASCALWVGLRRPTRGASWIFPVAVVPALCAAIGALACGANGIVFVALIGWPVAGAAIAFEAPVALSAWLAATAAFFFVAWSRGGLLAASVGTALLATMLGALAWVTHRKARMLRDLHAALSASTEKLAATLARNEALLASIPDTVSRVDRNGRFIEVRPGLNAPLPIRADDLVGHDVREFVPEHVAAEMTSVLERAFATGEVQSLRYHTEYEGKNRVFEARVTRAGASELLVLRRDFTQTVALEERLHAASRVAALGTLAASVGHEVNNPLTYVLGNVSIALDLVGEATRAAPPSSAIAPLRQMDEVLREALEGAERVRDIVQQLKMFTRSETGPEGLVDPRSVVEGALRMMRNQLTARARLSVALDPVPRVRGTETRLAQVVVNLLANAIDAIPEGHASEHEIAVRISAPPDEGIVLEVKDTGRGIEPDVLPRIFEPFFTTKGIGEGTGLGLAISHAIVRGFGGSIEVGSQVGQGTRFRVRLPPSPGEEARVGPASPPLESRTP